MYNFFLSKMNCIKFLRSYNSKITIVIKNMNSIIDNRTRFFKKKISKYSLKAKEEINKKTKNLKIDILLVSIKIYYMVSCLV